MPELPEVETIVNQLDKVLSEKIVANVEVLREKSFNGKNKELVGKKIKKVRRKSKIIVMEFEDWNMVLLVHLKMTGQLVFLNGRKRIVGGHPTDDWINDLPSKHTRVVVKFKDDSRLFFNDMRAFGWVKMVKESEWSLLEQKLPPDVVDKEFNRDYFKTILKSSRRAIKLFILDQGKMGGVGNIYANDALFLARVDPNKPTNTLSEKEGLVLRDAIRKVIDKGIALGGATYSNYKDSKGQGGKYQEHFLVYGKEGEACKNCKSKIQKFKLGGRGTYWCSSCQK